MFQFTSIDFEDKNPSFWRLKRLWSIDSMPGWSTTSIYSCPFGIVVSEIKILMVPTQMQSSEVDWHNFHSYQYFRYHPEHLLSDGKKCDRCVTAVDKMMLECSCGVVDRKVKKCVHEKSTSLHACNRLLQFIWNVSWHSWTVWLLYRSRQPWGSLTPSPSVWKIDDLKCTWNSLDVLRVGVVNC